MIYTHIGLHLGHRLPVMTVDDPSEADEVWMRVLKLPDQR